MNPMLVNGSNYKKCLLLKTANNFLDGQNMLAMLYCNCNFTSISNQSVNGKHKAW